MSSETGDGDDRLGRHVPVDCGQAQSSGCCWERFEFGGGLMTLDPPVSGRGAQSMPAGVIGCAKNVGLDPLRAPEKGYRVARCRRGRSRVHMVSMEGWAA